MQHDEITELAKGLVPFVCEVVAEATVLPPELALALKAAAEVLAEPMPAPPEFVAPVIPRRVTGAVITRSGELAIAYSDGASERLGQVIGPPGEKGAPGEPGRDGVGLKGDDGPRGRDGTSVTGAAINRDGELVLTLSNGTTLTPGRVVAREPA
jgi:hypothetical protein